MTEIESQDCILEQLKYFSSWWALPDCTILLQFSDKQVQIQYFESSLLEHE